MYIYTECVVSNVHIELLFFTENRSIVFEQTIRSASGINIGLARNNLITSACFAVYTCP